MSSVKARGWGLSKFLVFRFAGRLLIWNVASVSVRQAVGILEAEAEMSVGELIMRYLVMSLALVVLLASGSGAVGQDQKSAAGSDGGKIKAVIDRMHEAWNEHDMGKLAALFTEDAEFVNVGGTWWTGRKEIEAAHAEAHKRVFGKSRVTLVDHKIKMLGPETAVAVVTGNMEGHDLPPGAYRTNFNRFTAVLVKAEGDWKIAAIENTNMVEPPAKK
jgi:uncharacterized protein (TIGR02246 family)